MVTSLPAPPADDETKIHITLLECEAGAARRRWLEDWARPAFAGIPACVDCSMERRGPWAGLDQIFEGLARHLADQEPQLLGQHSYELLRVAPTLGDVVEDRYQSLTDSAQEEERVRLYPRDRALRIPHGLIDLLIECAERRVLVPPLTLACDACDDASVITRQFLEALIRRAGRRLGVRIAVGVRPGAGDRLLDLLGVSSVPAEVARTALVAGPEPAPPAGRGLHENARSLEARVGEDPHLRETLLPDLISVWTAIGDDRRALYWRAEAFARYTFLGLYDDAWTYGRTVVERLDEYAEDDERRRYKVLNKAYGCIGAMGDEEAIRTLPELAVREGLEKLTDPEYRGGVHYILAMLHARFLPDLDLDRAEKHLDLGLAELERSTAPEAKRRFQMAFNRNGLALIRFRQGRADEAIALCRDAREQLDRYLPAHEQRLHRSVLLYNISQVYSAMDDAEEALDHLSQAIALDPDYSEYYNDRGMLHFKVGRLQEAREDYLRAIALSPPYFEVCTNLGQCLRRSGHLEEAVRAYGRALDLQPDQPLALMGRADCHQGLGHLEEAYSDYTAALERTPDAWDCLGNRAVVLYALGRKAESLADLDRAVTLAPEAGELRRNRAVARTELGQAREAREDLERYLELDPQAADRGEVLAELQALAAG